MKGKLLLIILQIILGVAGFTLVWVYGSWQIALGIFLLLWGNNMMIMDNVTTWITKIIK